MPIRSLSNSKSSNLKPLLPSKSPFNVVRCSLCRARSKLNMARPVEEMRNCIVCGAPIPFDSSMELVVAECIRANCNQSCIHGRLASQNLNLCPVCKSVVGGNRFAPIFLSANTIDDNRNNVPLDDRRTEASFDFSSFICVLGLYWTYVIIFIIIIGILCCISYIF